MNKLTVLPLFLLLMSCGPRVEVIDDMGDASFELLTQDSTSVTFPDDFEGQYVVMGFIYTNCPDICSLITQNLVKIQKEMNYPDDVHFVAATFDPERDTPSTLKKYGDAFGVEEKFTFLTGDSTQVFALMDSARVRSQISMSDTTEDGRRLYFINHSDKIMVLDKQARLFLNTEAAKRQFPLW